MTEEKTTIREQLAEGRTVVVTTRGVSMQPLLYEGKTFVTIVPLRRPLKKLDLPIYFRPDGKYVIHRLVAMDDSHYYTRGDNCLSREIIPKDWVLGLVVQIHRKGKVIRVTDFSYRAYASFWNAIYPLRYCVYRFKSICRKLAGPAPHNKDSHSGKAE